MSGKRIIEGLKEAVAFINGDTTGARTHVRSAPDVAAIRKKLGLSQQRFAVKYGFSLGTLRHWEQGQRVPDGAARVLLAVIEKEPEAVERAIRSAA